MTSTAERERLVQPSDLRRRRPRHTRRGWFDTIIEAISALLS